MMPKAVYIHIPFCEHICYYCDFNKVFLKGQPVEDYLSALEQEIKYTLEKYPVKQLKTIYVGGGTPTSLSETQLERLCSIILKHFPLSRVEEFTFEANPGDLTKEKCQILHDAGVNRLSLGAQTFDDELLKKIGRVHRGKDIIHSIEIANYVGFQNINVDLMYALPGQTLPDLEKTLKQAFSLNIHHFSCYSLIVEPKTIFYQLMQKDRLSLPGEDIEADMYETVIEEMNNHGYFQYEISNFSRKGFESKHNLTYWNNEEYYGFGAGAHSYVERVRRMNVGPVNQYIKELKKGQLPIREENKLSRKEQIEEQMFLGLRKLEGVSINHFIEKFHENPLDLYHVPIKRLVQNQLISIENGFIKLTKKGLFLGNEVFEEFLL